MKNPDALWGLVAIGLIVLILAWAWITEAEIRKLKEYRRKDRLIVPPVTNHDAQERSDDWRWPS